MPRRMWYAAAAGLALAGAVGIAAAAGPTGRTREPAPAVPAVALSWFAFSQQIRSRKLFAGIVILLTTTIGLLGSSTTGSRSLRRSYCSG